MKLSCECGNETEFFARTTVEFIVDANGNREEKVDEKTEYFCVNCNEPAEIYEGD